MLEEDACLATVEIKVVGVALFIPLVLYKGSHAEMCNLSNFRKRLSFFLP